VLVISLSLILIFLYARCALAIVFLNMPAHESSNSLAKLSSNYILRFRERKKWDLRSIRVLFFFFFFFFLSCPVFHSVCPFSCDVNFRIDILEAIKVAFGQYSGLDFLRFSRILSRENLFSFRSCLFFFSANSRCLLGNPSRQRIVRIRRLAGIYVRRASLFGEI